MTKEELRKNLISKRSIIENRGEKDRFIRERFFAENFACDKVLCFVSRGDEVDTLGIIFRLLDKGVAVCAPRCVPGGNQMDFCRIHSLGDLEDGAFGLLEPRRDCPVLTDMRGALCLVPGLAFTESGDRIGYGKGYYDRFLHENRVNAIRKVGLCYNELIRENIPVTPKDEKVSIIITEVRVILTPEKEAAPSE